MVALINTLLSCVVINNCAIWSTDHKVVINLSWVNNCQSLRQQCLINNVDTVVYSWLCSVFVMMKFKFECCRNRSILNQIENPTDSELRFHRTWICGFTSTLWTEKNTPKCFSIYCLQTLTDCDKICYTSWVNLSYRNVNVFCLTWIVSLPYLVKLSMHILQVNSS